MILEKSQNDAVMIWTLRNKFRCNWKKVWKYRPQNVFWCDFNILIKVHVQCGIVITRSIFSQILKKTPHILPVRARYGVCFVDPASGRNSVPALVIIYVFLHDQPWISPWISQLSCHCDVSSNRLWRHQRNKDRASETGTMCKDRRFMYSLCHVRNRMIYVLSWRTVSALTRVLFCYLFPSLLRNSGNKHQNNPLVSTQTVRHSSTYIIFYISHIIGPRYDGTLLYLYNQHIEDEWCMNDSINCDILDNGLSSVPSDYLKPYKPIVSQTYES